MSTVHPHACGEHSTCAHSRSRNSGSSPRMWGTLLLGNAEVRRIRFIPTHVGNTPDGKMRIARTAVHPHACGEHYYTLKFFPTTPGSSPRMWGTQVLDDYGQEYIRFIPTHVGNTPTSTPTSGFRAVHPHACGEHLAGAGSAPIWPGSSPRMWGTHQSYPIEISFKLESSKFHRLFASKISFHNSTSLLSLAGSSPV